MLGIFLASGPSFANSSMSPGAASFAPQLALIVTAIFLGLLLWRIWHRRAAQEAGLLEEIREREERLNLALWGSGDEFWD